MTLLGFIAKALKLEEGEIERLVDDGMQAVRMTYYPPCPRPDLVMGLTPHSDATVITILLQVNGVDGLQIKKGGLWVPVSFLPDALVVNVGDVLEVPLNFLSHLQEIKNIVYCPYFLIFLIKHPNSMTLPRIIKKQHDLHA